MCFEFHMMMSSLLQLPVDFNIWVRELYCYNIFKCCGPVTQPQQPPWYGCFPSSQHHQCQLPSSLYFSSKAVFFKFLILCTIFMTLLWLFVVSLLVSPCREGENNLFTFNCWQRALASLAGGAKHSFAVRVNCDQVAWVILAVMSPLTNLPLQKSL